MKNKKIIVRFAPSPTGPLHIGGVRTVLYNYIFYKKYDGKFILRIEDTDELRYVYNSEKYIVRSLNWLGIKFNHFKGNFFLYKQSNRKYYYDYYILKLIKSKNAYYAFDTESDLDNMKNYLKSYGNKSPKYNYITRNMMKNSFTLSFSKKKIMFSLETSYVIRLKIPSNVFIKFKDLIKGFINVNSSNLDDKVLIKSTGIPTYHIANVIDDYLMNVTHVIRGDEWLPSMPIHFIIYKYLNFYNYIPEFLHLPLLLNPNSKGKLSKRLLDKYNISIFPIKWKHNKIIKGYKDVGYLPDALINFIFLLGLNSENLEIFDKDLMINYFSINKINKSSINFNINKLNWFNQNYIKKKSDQFIFDFFFILLKDKSIFYNTNLILKICNLVKSRVFFINDFWNKTFYFFNTPNFFYYNLLRKKTNAYVSYYLKLFFDELDLLNSFFFLRIKSILNSFKSDKFNIVKFVRTLITGSAFGPDLSSIIEVLGKRESLLRLNIFFYF